MNNLKTNRRKDKVLNTKRTTLTVIQREIILKKTDSRCHICGVDLDKNNFQADHVKSHSAGGIHAENNYLPSCSTCNNYRWHYTSEDIQIILRLGVWAKTKIVNDPLFGLEIANQYVKYEMGVRKRRKNRMTKNS